MRSFIAISLPCPIKSKIAEAQTKLKELNLPLKWINPDNLHLTLKFLGNIHENQINDIKNVLDLKAKSLKKINISLGNYNFFPNDKKPRIFFIELFPKKILTDLAYSLEEDLEKLGFEKEGRFKPHVTLARIKNLAGITQLKNQINSLKLNIDFLAKDITFYKSTLTESGPVYEIIAKSPFTA